MSLSDSCRWIAFDAVGTLIEADPPVAEVYHRVGRAHGSRQTLAEVRSRFRDTFQQRSSSESQQTSEAIEYVFWQQFVGQVLGDLDDHASCFAELHAWFARPSAWRCFDDVGPSLSALRDRGFQLAIASNFDARLHPVCDGHPELQDITTRVISSEVGWRKPHSEFYQALVHACGGDPTQILMVGDDRENDVYGARRAGLHALFIDRPHSTANVAGETAVITSLRELSVSKSFRS